jgi:uncharacterized protein with WD repeat
VEELKVSDPKAQAFEYKEHKTLSILRLVTLSNEGVHLYQVKTNAQDTIETIIKIEELDNYQGAEIAKFSPIHGKFLAVVDHRGIHIIDVETKEVLMIIEKRGIISLEWSPKSTFVISCTKCKEGSNNLNVWDVTSGKLVYECEWKNTAKEGPKSIKFDDQERFCAR